MAEYPKPMPPSSLTAIEGKKVNVPGEMSSPSTIPLSNKEADPPLASNTHQEADVSPNCELLSIVADEKTCPSRQTASRARGSLVSTVSPVPDCGAEGKADPLGSIFPTFIYWWIKLGTPVGLSILTTCQNSSPPLVKREYDIK